MRILIVEDTLDVGEAILARLRRLGHDVDWETTGPCADDRLAVQPYELVILDVMLPGDMDGFEVLRNLRARKDRTPVLMLTARSEVDDRVGALDLGAGATGADYRGGVLWWSTGTDDQTRWHTIDLRTV
jgi:two-component system response regulator TctD